MKFKSLICLALLTLAMSVIPAAAAQTVVTQLPQTCTQGSTYMYLPPGGSYSSVPAAGFYFCAGNNILLPFGASGTTLELTGGNFTNATATLTTITAGGVPFAWPVLANTNYRFSCTLMYQQSTTTVELEVGVSTPSSPTNLSGVAQIYTLANGTNTLGALSSGTFTGAASATDATTYIAHIDGTLENGATAGTLAFQVAEAATGTITIVRGSYCSVTTGN